MPVLQVFTVSTREGRVGSRVSAWFLERARRDGAFDVEHVDLAELALPMLEEPHHPRLRRYVHDHTKRWSATVERADAFVLVTPEYNYGSPPSLLNAVDHLFHEWAYKPAAFVSYGGVSGGTRSVAMTKQVLTTLKMMPIPEAVTIPFVQRFLPEGGGPLAPDEAIEGAVSPMLAELSRWERALRPLRRP